MTIFYADASAVVKLILREDESDALEAFFAGVDVVSCDLLLTEVPRAVRRAAAADADIGLTALLERAHATLDPIGLQPLEAELLADAGALTGPGLRSLDAIHVAAAHALTPLDGFVTYDVRQAAAARLGGFRTFSPGSQ